MDLHPGLVHIAAMWLICGWICVALGAVGAVLPLMPTVPFLLGAAYCFERGSPRLHAWLMSHPRFGPPLVDWNHHGVIRWPAKLLACGGLLVSGGYTAFFSERPEAVRWTVGMICVLVIGFILTRKSKR